MNHEQIYKIRLGDREANAYTDEGIVYVITHSKHRVAKSSWKLDVSPLDDTTRLFVETGNYGRLHVIRTFMGLSQDSRYALTLRRLLPKTSDSTAVPEWVLETFTSYLDHVILYYLRVLQDARWIQHAPQIVSCVEAS